MASFLMWAGPMFTHASTGLFSIRDALPGVRCEKVLCWVDSTTVPDQVVRVARLFAAIGGEPCHVVMCLNPGIGDFPSDCLSQGLRAPLTPEVIADAAEGLQKLYGNDVHTMILPGHPVTEIRRYAVNHRVDLIVVGGQGLALERACGQRLCDDAPCAMVTLVLPEGERGEAPAPGRGQATPRAGKE